MAQIDKTKLTKEVKDKYSIYDTYTPALATNTTQ